MSDDRTILRDLWEGKVPVGFTLSPDEVISERPEPLYLMVPRQCYFPLVTDKISKYLTQYVDKEKVGEMWLEYEGQPLKWHYPVGVLFDLYGSSHLHSLPWKLTVHFQNFPEEDIIHCPSRDAVKSHFMSVLKEADFLKHRGSVINNMQKHEHQQMWNSLVNDKFDQFWPINKKLMESSEEDMFKCIPFKIYQSDCPVIQKLLRPHSEEGKEHTLRDLLELAYSNNDDICKKKVLIQGIEVPLETPILWLSEHFSYPDNFLHIIVPKSEPMSSSW